jgi:hypothetical protein
MEKQFDLLKRTRLNVLDLGSKFTIEELNIIPPHFNNNIIWNAGHLIATQQVLLYSLSDLEYTIYLDFVERYRKGTRPDKFIGEEEWNFIKENLIKTIYPAAEDYKQKKFQRFRTYETSYGITLEDIDDAIAFNNVHEGMHFGFMKAIGKTLGK